MLNNALEMKMSRNSKIVVSCNRSFWQFKSYLIIRVNKYGFQPCKQFLELYKPQVCKKSDHKVKVSELKVFEWL